ncbi:MULTISPECIES: sensor histidine kinase [Streptomycetaceae]|uniref:sensor histidine kinase n=1 Tax=Streptomycetaceae TaxID=2062 RepID=UPI0005AB57B9|nr:MULTISPECIES: sensor histidine kinase [Streptomycetaceae]
MPRLTAVRRDDVVRRLARGVRELPRTLVEDLWTNAAQPLPRVGRPRWLDWRPAYVVLVAMCAVLLFIPLTNRYIVGFGMGVVVAVVLAGVQASGLVLALFRPVLAWWASTGAAALGAWTATVTRVPWHGIGRWGEPGAWNGPGLATQAGVVFLVALLTRPRVAVEVLVISVLLVTAWDRLHLAGAGFDHNLAYEVLVIAVIVGAALRSRGVARTQLVVQAELTAEERGRRTLLEERNRIARELHDVVAHHMSVISIQAQVAPHLVEAPSAELTENLAGIRQNAVEALAELRRVLGVLRSEDALAEGLRHAPQPTLARLDELVGNVRGAGLAVTTRTTGQPRPLPPGVELSAFRIVQEALSNAMRHAPGAGVRVALGYHDTTLTVRVTNTAPERAASPSPGVGHGLLGMRERAAMLGGELATGPTPDGGYEVSAILPVQAPPTRTEDRP